MRIASWTGCNLIDLGRSSKWPTSQEATKWATGFDPQRLTLAARKNANWPVPGQTESEERDLRAGATHINGDGMHHTFTWTTGFEPRRSTSLAEASLATGCGKKEHWTMPSICILGRLQGSWLSHQAAIHGG